MCLQDGCVLKRIAGCAESKGRSQQTTHSPAFGLVKDFLPSPTCVAKFRSSGPGRTSSHHPLLKPIPHRKQNLIKHLKTKIETPRPEDHRKRLAFSGRLAVVGEKRKTRGTETEKSLAVSEAAGRFITRKKPIFKILAVVQIQLDDFGVQYVINF